MKCKICHNENNNKVHVVREMLFGYRDEFEYVECNRCGCLQIKDYPQDLAKHYPSDYYSFRSSENKRENIVMRWARRKRAEFGLTQKGLLGRVIARAKPLPAYYETLRKCNLTLDSKILDVGCGSGSLIKLLYREGFRNLMGIDAYLPSENVEKKRGMSLSKLSLNDFAEISYNDLDLVMMHHSLEHMADHYEVFQTLSSVLGGAGYVWITMPVLSYAWRHYGVNWCGLDAPRHLLIHSHESFKLLCRETSFDIIAITHNSTGYQFIASEQFSRDISLLDEKSYIVNPQQSIFTEEQIESFEAEARKLNDRFDGDSASFLLKKRYH